MHCHHSKTCFAIYSFFVLKDAFFSKRLTQKSYLQRHWCDLHGQPEFFNALPVSTLHQLCQTEYANSHTITVHRLFFAFYTLVSLNRFSSYCSSYNWKPLSLLHNQSGVSFQTRSALFTLTFRFISFRTIHARTAASLFPWYNPKPVLACSHYFCEWSYLSRATFHFLAE